MRPFARNILMAPSALAAAVALTPVLDLKFNGTNGGTVFTDDTGRHVMSKAGTFYTDTAQFYEGVSSANVTSTGYLYGGGSDFLFNKDFDFICYVRFNATTPKINIFTLVGASNYLEVFFNTAAKPSLAINGVIQGATVNTMPTNTFTKLQLKRVGALITLTLNNDVVNAFSVSNTAIFGDSSTPLYIGNYTGYRTVTGSYWMDVLTIGAQL